MSVQMGDMLPYGNFLVMGQDGPESVDVTSFFANKTVLMFAVPGAFTPTCSARHLPGYVSNYQAFKDKGVDDVVCLSVNDVFVMDAWGKAHHADSIVMAADNLAQFTQALGLEIDIATAQMGLRSRRYAMLVENGVIQHLWLEEPGEFGISSAEQVLSQL
ncbi:Hybrid peroxiredoxin hyPrx5 [Marinomonas aquimarina]|uniref:Glutathione-dependent peroxiredoxin n=1 Tax=Marinomonas aquimarina TaxID=295068 RepID=A0A1A8TKC2_9GAMM|nr:peroxiredoxin [Marinomonas aquimarina]SBS33981.1 Hybrid peroxiredoxin hyPrx5 [Marinomonas aquimarina]